MKPTNRPFWLCAGMTLINALTSAGFSIASLLASGAEPVNAMYGVSRSISLALVVILVIILRSPTGVMVLALIMVLVQTGDALIGGLNHDLIKTIGPAFLALLTGLTGLSLWRSMNLRERAEGG